MSPLAAPLAAVATTVPYQQPISEVTHRGQPLSLRMFHPVSTVPAVSCMLRPSGYQYECSPRVNACAPLYLLQLRPHYASRKVRPKNAPEKRVEFRAQIRVGNKPFSLSAILF